MRALLQFTHFYHSAHSYCTRSVDYLPTHSVRVCSIDHDRCFGLPFIDIQDIEPMSADIIDHLKDQKEKAKYTHDYVMSCSIRQSMRLDCQNTLNNQNNLMYPVALTLANALGAWFDPLLLADITAYRKPGYTISCFKQELAKNGLTLSKDRIPDEVLMELMEKSDFDFTCSEDKINIIYAQMHRISSIHPDAFICFNVFDDMLHTVLKKLKTFYGEYPSLVPRNILLNLYHFDTSSCFMARNNFPELPMEYFSMQGIGTIDRNYYKTIKIMGEIAKTIEGTSSNVYSMSDYITPCRLQEALCDVPEQTRRYLR